MEATSAVHEIIITDASGTIAQSVAGIIRRREWPAAVRLVGLSAMRLVPAAALFDVIVTQPETYTEVAGPDGDFLATLCSEARPRLIIPSTDYEALFFSRLEPRVLGAHLLVSSPHAHAVGHDKYLTFQEFQRIGLPIARTCLPSAYSGQFGDDFVVKPRSCGLSRDVHQGPLDLTRFDDSYVIQERLREPEITLALYVTRVGEVIGPIVFERTLQYGMTFFCVRRPDLEEALVGVSESVAAAFNVRGPCNLQGRYHDDGTFAIFEMNCRISGTCGIRAALGFDDVTFAVGEYLFDVLVVQPALLQGGGYRRIDEHIVVGATTIDDVAAQAVRGRRRRRQE